VLVFNLVENIANSTLDAVGMKSNVISCQFVPLWAKSPETTEAITAPDTVDMWPVIFTGSGVDLVAKT